MEIGYKASEDISVVITKIEREDLSGNNVGTTTFFPKTGETSASAVAADRKDKANKYTFMKECSVTKDDKSIILTHDIVNEDENPNSNDDGYQGYGDDYDFTPYYITLLVTMNYTDGNNQAKSMTEEIQVIQYPEVYIEAKQNSDGGDNEEHNLMVNSYYTSQTDIYEYNYTQGNNADTADKFGTAPGIWLQGGNTNVNPNMYVVNVSSLSSNSNYIIGDPRELSVNDDFIESADWANAVSLSDPNGTRELQNYYRTDYSGTSGNTNPSNFTTGWMIAPKFRVASSYSVTHNTNTRDLAEKRCASYQEDGYPAGRWRLPTYAEAAFIVSLSNEKKIPYLFNTNTNYWCAHGDFKPNGNNVDLNPSGDASSVRCVYDEWYWGSERAALKDDNGKDLFTWGDAPRTNTSIGY